MDSAAIRARLDHPVIDADGHLFASDIGHWDVPDVRRVLAEAWELVEDGHLTPGDFREFTFGNAVRLWAGTNPDFFSGTVVEAAVSTVAGTRVAGGG